jgi:hypothetical protein
MTSFRQIEANRRNARKSTGPMTEDGKQRSHCNAIRHGLTAEAVIGALEDADDYKAFEAAIIADYDAQGSGERELVLRLASLLWRLRRATTMETGQFKIQAGHLNGSRKVRQVNAASREAFYALILSVLRRCASRLRRRGRRPRTSAQPHGLVEPRLYQAGKKRPIFPLPGRFTK